MCVVCARDFLERTLDGAGTRPVVACRAVQRHTQTDAAVGETLKRLLLTITLGLNLRLSNHRDHRARGRAGDAHAGGSGDTFPSLSNTRARRSCPALHWTLTGCSAKSIVLLSPALWAGEQRRIIQPRCLAASAALRRQRCRARGSAPPPKVSRSGGRKPAASGASDGAPRRARRMERCPGRVGWSAASGASDGAPRRARRMERTRRRAPLLLISRRALRASRVASRRRSGCGIGRLMKPKEAQLVVDA